MQVTIDPPMHTWKPRVPDAALIARRRALGFSEPEKPIIATGHQAGFWHPGILAKCITAVEFAKKVGAQPLYVMVDHDANDALKIELPAFDGDRLLTRAIHLGAMEPDVAVVAQRHVDWKIAKELLLEHSDELSHSPKASLAPLTELFATNFVHDETFAHEIGDHMRRLWKPIVGELPVRMATEMRDSRLVHRMLHDARNCVHHYNDAVTQHADAGVPPLLIERDRVELPLWHVGNPWAFVHDSQRDRFVDWPVGSDGKQHYIPRPRERVFVDLADSEPLLVRESGEPVPFLHRDHDAWDPLRGFYVGLAPRALTLTAMLRSTFCDLFIHGLGGGVYDRAMEMWWHDWTGEPLAPMAVVTADVRLDFPGVAVAEEKDVERAVWYAHHLPHNLDRLPSDVVNQTLADRKRELLTHMNDDRDHKRRAAAFREIHEINRKLAEQNGDIVMLAKQQVERAKIGAANREVAMKRDWSFALYPKEKMEELKRVIAEAAGRVG